MAEGARYARVIVNNMLWRTNILLLLKKLKEVSIGHEPNVAKQVVRFEVKRGKDDCAMWSRRGDNYSKVTDADGGSSSQRPAVLLSTAQRRQTMIDYGCFCMPISGLRFCRRISVNPSHKPKGARKNHNFVKNSTKYYTLYTSSIEASNNGLFGRLVSTLNVAWRLHPWKTKKTNQPWQ